MKSIFTLQLSFLLFFFLAAPGILFGENTEEPQSEKEAKPDPKIEFAERVKAFEKFVKTEVNATKLPSGKRTQLQAMAVAAYRENELKPLWSDSVDLADTKKALVKLLERHGFEEPTLTFSPNPNPADSDENLVPPQDLLITLTVAETSLLLKQGPDTISEWPNWSFGDAPEIKSSSAHWDDVTEKFGEAAAGSEGPQQVAKAFIPQNRIYQQILTEIHHADPTAEAPKLEVKKLVKVGYKFQQAPELARFLVAEGHLTEENLEDEDEPKIETETEEKSEENESPPEKPGIHDGIYTKELAEAVREFQKMNGLQADGILGPKTAQRISNSDEEEAKALLINLHRARRFPDNPGEIFLHANIPSGEVYGFRAGKETIRMRIVFGKNRSGQRTPIFRDTMEQVVFRPYWNVPYSIAVSESNYSDTGYLSRNGFKIISSSGRSLPLTIESLEKVRTRQSYVRQEAGTNNALGIVKFLFPNKHSVYFHDTPHKHYFKNSYRAQSHGCVRLEKPEAMANWVLEGDEEWDSEKISSALKGRRQEVDLEKNIPVYITYFTALPDASKDDKIGFYRDIYHYDRPGAVVDAPGPRPKPVQLTPPEDEEEKPASIFSLFSRKGKNHSDQSTSSTNRRHSLFSKSRR